MSQNNVFPQEGILEMLAVFARVVKELSIDYFVVGAIARDIRLSRLPGYTPGRITKDVDIAIMVGSDQEFAYMKEGLLQTGAFTAHEKIAIKLFYKQAIEIDLLPFGGIEGSRAEVRIEKPRPFVMDVPGFKEAWLATEVLIIGGVELRVCSLEGIILLKLFANSDNPSRTKDIHDIENILNAYFDIATEDIFSTFVDVPDLYAVTDPDYMRLVSARVVGRVMRRMLRGAPALHARLCSILREKTPNRYWPEMSAGLEE